MQNRALPYGQPQACRCLIKLGGSAITVKHQHETLKPEVLESVVSTCKQLYHNLQQQEGRPGFVVVHGAGSFGHFEASQYGITRPLETPQATLLEGFAKTRSSVTRLNTQVVAALVAAGVPAVGLSPFGSCFCVNGVLSPAWQQGYVDAVQATLCSGLIPVLHGDGILEAPGPDGRYREGAITPAILSGDKIMLCLASELSPQYAVFLTDVPGLLTAPPDQPGAQLIPRVWVQGGGTQLQYELPGQQQAGAPEDSSQQAAASGVSAPQQHQQQQQQQVADVRLTTAQHDTTGGMAAKIQAAADIAVAAAAPVIIAQAGSAAAAAAVLQGAGSGSGSLSGCTVVECVKAPPL